VNDLKFETIIRSPKNNFKITLVPDLIFELPGRIPNRFHRIMMRVFFGWKIEALK